MYRVGYVSSFENGLTFPSIKHGCWAMTCQSWPLCALFVENVWKNCLRNWLFVSGKVILLAPGHSWSLIFGIVVPYYEFYKRYLGFFWILSFWPIFGFLRHFQILRLKKLKRRAKRVRIKSLFSTFFQSFPSRSQPMLSSNGLHVFFIRKLVRVRGKLS